VKIIHILNDLPSCAVLCACCTLKACCGSYYRSSHSWSWSSYICNCSCTCTQKSSSWL